MSSEKERGNIEYVGDNPKAHDKRRTENFVRSIAPSPNERENVIQVITKRRLEEKKTEHTFNET